MGGRIKRWTVRLAVVACWFVVIGCIVVTSMHGISLAKVPPLDPAPWTPTATQLRAARAQERYYESFGDKLRNDHESMGPWVRKRHVNCKVVRCIWV